MKISRLISPSERFTSAFASTSSPLRDDPVEHLLGERGAGNGHVQLVGKFEAQPQVLVEHLARVRAELALEPAVGDAALRRAGVDRLLEHLGRKTGLQSNT